MNNSSSSVIKLDSISKVFETDEMQTHALSGISLDILRGEFVVIEGPSGCGKSTLLSLLGLLDEPTSGQYVLNGTATTSLNARQRAKIRNREIGFIFQGFNLIGDLSVFQNVELPLTHRSMNKADRHARVMEVLESVEMTHRANHYPGQLSGGQQQRIAVARAIAGKPSIILADEPTGNLDSKNGEAVMGLLNSLHAAGATVCIVTHDPRYIEQTARSVKLFDGKLGTPKAVVTS